MFVDACAIISIIMRENDAPDYATALRKTSEPFTSALAAWEASIVLSRPDRLACSYSQALDVVLEWLDGWGVELNEPGAPRDVLAHAVLVAEAHGLGKRALSNFDCFHYAHAKAAGGPMLTLDRLLARTDLPTLP